MKFKKISTLLLVTILAASMSACGPKAGGSTEATAKPESASTAATDAPAKQEATAAPNEQAAATATVSAPGVLPIVSEKTTLDVTIIQLSDTLTDVATNTFTKELEDMTNVHLNMTIYPGQSYGEKMNLALASDNYPEVYMGASFTNADLMKYGADEKILIPLNDLIEKHSVDLKKRWADNPALKSDMTAPDGNMYGLPFAEAKVGHGATGYKLWFNETWLNNLNLKRPTTTDEFRTVLEAFKTQDPNKNGKADEIPMSGAIKTWAGDVYFYLLNAYGFYHENLLMLENGKVSGCADQDYIKEGLRYVKSLYDAGLIDPAALTQDQAQLAAIGSNEGDVIVGSATCGHLGMLLSINDVERSKMYNVLEPLTGPTGYKGVPFSKEVRATGATFAITDKCKQPEVAFKMADLFSNDDIVIRTQVGIKGKHWVPADPNTFGMDGKTPATYKILPAASEPNQNDNWGWTSRTLEPYWKGLAQVDGDIFAPENYEARLQQETDKLEPFAAKAEKMPPFFMNAETSASLSQIQEPLKDYVQTSFTEFITGKKSLDTDWDGYVSGLKNLKYDEYISINQTAFDAKAK